MLRIDGVQAILLKGEPDQVAHQSDIFPAKNVEKSARNFGGMIRLALVRRDLPPMCG